MRPGRRARATSDGWRISGVHSGGSAHERSRPSAACVCRHARASVSTTPPADAGGSTYLWAAPRVVGAAWLRRRGRVRTCAEPNIGAAERDFRRILAGRLIERTSTLSRGAHRVNVLARAMVTRWADPYQDQRSGGSRVVFKRGRLSARGIGLATAVLMWLPPAGAQAQQKAGSAQIAAAQDVVTLLLVKSVHADPSFAGRPLATVIDERPITLVRTTLPVLDEATTPTGRRGCACGFPVGSLIARRRHRRDGSPPPTRAGAPRPGTSSSTSTRVG